MAPALTYVDCQDVTDPRVVVTDFGEAWLVDDPEAKDQLNTPVIFLPPEATLAKDAIGPPADVWSLACSLYDIMGERPLFEGFMPDADAIIAEMVSALGKLPEPWWGTWKGRDLYFEEDGTWKHTGRHDTNSRPLLLCVQEMGREDDEEFLRDEALSLYEMLSAMFTYEPGKRATAQEVVKSDWMNRFGLPALREYGISV